MKEVKSIKTNILGEKYTINLNTPREILTDCDGSCSRYDKLISMVDRNEIFDGSGTEKGRRKRYAEGLRHEIIHAFFEESGLDNYSEDEELVQWLAIQFPKLIKVFEDVDDKMYQDDFTDLWDVDLFND